MEVCINRNPNAGLMGMINQHSWMFLSSYEKLRENVLDNYTISNMLHLGPRLFDELSGEVVQSTAFVLKNEVNENFKGDYYRLVDYKSSGGKKEQFALRIIITPKSPKPTSPKFLVAPLHIGRARG